jgi:hypothetical protein
MTALTPEGIRSQSVQTWRGRLASLHSHHVDESDPRLRECLTALTYHRQAKVWAQLVADGHLSRSFAASYLDALARHLCDPAVSRDVGGFIAESVSL